MIIAIDFDGTLVVQKGRPYDDVTSPFVMMPGALEALRAFRRAGHQVIIWSARASLALRKNPLLDPLARTNRKVVNLERWRRSQPINQARYDQMLAFCTTGEMAELIDAVDDGTCGKVSADLFLDDKAMRIGRGEHAWAWPALERLYGLPLSSVARALAGPPSPPTEGSTGGEA